MSINDEADMNHGNGTRSGTGKQGNRIATPADLPGFSVDDIMWRVRAEVTRRRNGQLNGVTFPAIPSEVRPFDLSMPTWKPGVPRLPVKDTYHLTELLAFSDADFIDAAYRAILRRPPDETGFNHYLRVLRGGGAAKILILQEFLSTPEGQASGVRIEGLSLPILLEEWRRKKYIGPIIGWVHALLRLGTFADRQSTLDANQAREVQELGRLVNEASENFMQRLIALRVEFAGRVRAPEFESLRNEHAATRLQVGKLATEMEREFTERPDRAAFRSHMDNLESEVRTRYQTFEEHINSLKATLDTTALSLQQLRTRDEQATAALRALDPFYAAFEDRFRGDRSIVRTRVEPYLALVREVGAGTSDAPVLDIGCGRGEWLELIRDCGLIGRGVEINRVFIDVCRGRGLEVLEGDAIDTLRAMPNGSAGAITSLHVIEHLPFERAIALLDEAYRVLRPGGLLILETPNPENLSVAHHWFYMDPTHRNPLPPEALRWIVEARSFHNVRIERLVLARELNVPSPLPNDVPGAEAINMMLASMSAAQDYAIVGKRP